MTRPLIGAIIRPASTLSLAIIVSLSCNDKTETQSKAPSSTPVPSARTAPEPVASAALPKSQQEPEVPSRPKRTLKDCPPGNTVEFPSPEFEAAVRLKLQKPEGPITKAQLKSLRSLNLSQIKLDDIDVCTFTPMTGLKELFLGPGDYDDLSPLKGATGLESLGASRNKIKDLSPIAGLAKLDRLDLAKTQVEDIGVIANMKNLTELQLDDTKVSDLSPLKELTKLERVSIKNTQVKDVSALRNAEKLQFLYIAGSPVASEPGALAPVRRAGTRVVDE